MARAYLEGVLGRTKGLFDLATDDLRLILVMSNTSAGSETDLDTAVFVSDITTLDEYDGAGYPTSFSSRVALSSVSLVKQASSNKVELQAGNPSFGTLSAGSRNAVAALLYQHNTSDSDSRLIAYLDGGDFPFNGNGTPVSLVFPGGVVADFT